MLKPINRRVLVKAIDQPAMERYGSLIVPKDVDSRIKEGIVEEVGIIHDDENKILVEKGNRILFISSGYIFTREGVEYRVLDESSIVAVVIEESKPETKEVTEKVKILKDEDKPKPPPNREMKEGQQPEKPE